MMQQGRGGMGNHKHAISGHSGPNPKAKFMRALDANRMTEAEKQRKPKNPVYQTIGELLAKEAK